MSTAVDMLGKQVGALTVIGRATSSNSYACWECKCVCGNIVTARGSNLRVKQQSSCGCIRYGNRGHNKNYNWKGYKEIGKQFFNQLTANAKSRGLSCDITIEDIWELYIKQNKYCNLSGLPIQFKKPTTASVDRIDSSKGYTLDNIQLVHKTINIMKMDLPDQDFINLCHKVSEYSYPDSKDIIDG